MVSSMQLSMQMQKGSKGDGTFGYMTEEQFEQLKNSDFVEQAGHRRTIGYASNAVGHSVELNYADSIQQELTFCVPTHGSAPEKANEIATTELALKALGVEPEIGAEVPLEFELRGKTYHYDMVLSGWWEASTDMVSVAVPRVIYYSCLVYDSDSVYQYPQTSQKGRKSISHGGDPLYGAG